MDNPKEKPKQVKATVGKDLLKKLDTIMSHYNFKTYSAALRYCIAKEYDEILKEQSQIH